MQVPSTLCEMERRLFGSTDMRVCRLGLGGHEIAVAPLETVERLLHHALDTGINVIDTAECYGPSEELIGRALAGRRSDYYIFSKCGHSDDNDPTPDWHTGLLEQSIERSLKRLRTDVIDLMQLHSCSKKILQQGEVIEVLQRARQAGKIRYLGYSGDRQNALYAIRTGVFDVLQTTINIADQEALDLTLPAAKERGMGIIAKQPLANAAWNVRTNQTLTYKAYNRRLKILDYAFLRDADRDPAGTALRFTLSVPGVDIAIAGTANQLHLQHNIDQAAQGKLPAAQFEEIRARWRKVTHWSGWIPGARWGWHGGI